LTSETTKTAAQTALSVEDVGHPNVISVSGPAVRRSVQTTSVAAAAATAARKATASAPRDSPSAAQSATDAAKSTPTSPSKSIIERKTKPPAKGKCQPLAGGASKRAQIWTASTASRSTG
jgi:hypothetical protein